MVSRAGGPRLGRARMKGQGQQGGQLGPDPRYEIRQLTDVCRPQLAALFFVQVAPGTSVDARTSSGNSPAP